MRERIQFENELVDLGLRDAIPVPSPKHAFEAAEPLAYEVPEPYQIKGGLYSPKEKALAARDRRGLVLTFNVVGKHELSLASRGPATTMISKEMSRFEGGQLGEFVENYNAFSNYFEEILRAIGRLRDLLSAGAPEAPTDMTRAQKFSLRPTDNTQPNAKKKEAYYNWRTAQEKYAAAGQGGKLIAGRVYEVARAGQDFDLARQAFWQAQGRLRRTIDEARRKSSNKPKYDMPDVKLSDVLTVVEGGWVAAGADILLEARKNRQEYDAKMKDFAENVKHLDAAIRDEFEAFRNAGTVYWAKNMAYRVSIIERNKARLEARRRAATLGQHLAPTSEKRDPVLAEIRMPILVSDAWRALAIIGPPALKKLTSVLAAGVPGGLLEKANFHYRNSKPDPFGVEDITNIVKAYQRAVSWKSVLTREEVEEWIGINKLWDETFNKFNV